MASLLLIDPCMCSIWIVGRMEIVDGFRLWKLCVYGVDEQELRLLVESSRLLLFSPARNVGWPPQCVFSVCSSVHRLFPP
jgi:hypothetical protein